MMGIDIDKVIVFTFVLGVGARRRRRRAVRAARADDGVDRLRHRAQGLHRRRDRRHRLDPRRDGGRPDPRLRSSRTRRATSRRKWSDLYRLLDPDRVHDLPAPGASRPRGHPEGLRYERLDATRFPHARRRGLPIGQDEWVARHAERRVCRRGRSQTIEDRLRRVSVVGVARALRRRVLACFPVVETSGYVRRVAFDTVLLHAARARPQRRRRLGRPARPRLRRLLRDRRVHLRAARLADSTASTCRRT